MTWQRSIALVLASLVLLATPAAAQKPAPVDPARVAAAKELLAAVGTAKQFDTAMPMMMQQMTNMFVQMSPKHEKEIREVFGTMLGRFSARKQEMFDQVAVLYAERFTAAEMTEVSRFFTSGIGAKFVASQPELLQQSMAIGQRWGERIGREIEQEVRQELKKRGVPI